jgi:GMP synthase (glutamine-hydrolysing)
MSQDIHDHRILILDFGSQYTQLIARRVREIGVYCELWSWDVTQEQIESFNPTGIILAGGPESVTEDNSPRAPEYVFNAGVPVLGICYGMQTMAEQLGGGVESSEHKEFGYASVELIAQSALFNNVEDSIGDNGNTLLDVWMSHGDKVSAIPDGFITVAQTPSCAFGAIANEAKKFYGVQFHPEVVHTLHGEKLLANFVKNIVEDFV